MRFCLVDRITKLEMGDHIEAVKAVSLAEEYLADHFPSFPILPGVFMLESLTEAAAWLVRASEDFAHSMILLAEAKNVTYKSFLKPGNLLETKVTCRRLAQDSSDFVGVGYCDGIEVVKGRFSLRHFNLSERSDKFAAVDARIVKHAREQLGVLLDTPLGTAKLGATNQAIC
ncbi:MAG: beta-hydroxyacyl-ACP dehydratase [Planctomycetes bacterium]|nr:beta-hydroxyacyl-ACP dehydratase [Planctomycetota bacterium]